MREGLKESGVFFQGHLVNVNYLYAKRSGGNILTADLSSFHFILIHI